MKKKEGRKGNGKETGRELRHGGHLCFGAEEETKNGSTEKIF